MGAWVVAVDPAAEDCNGRTAGFEAASMCPPVNAAREAGDNRDVRSGKTACERASDVRAVVAAGASADDRDRGAREQLGSAAAAQEQTGRRVVNRFEVSREAGIRAP